MVFYEDNAVQRYKQPSRKKNEYEDKSDDFDAI